MELENLEDLVDFTIPTEKRLLFSQFSEDASHSPDIHSKTVLFLPEKHLGSTVPQGLDLVSESLYGETKGSCQPEICNFEIAGPIDE